MRRTIPFAAALGGLLSLLPACSLAAGPAAAARSSVTEAAAPDAELAAAWRPGLRPVATQPHLHGPLSEGPGSYASHLDRARRLGVVEVIWVTEHDWRMLMHSLAPGFGFEEGEATESFTIPRRFYRRGEQELEEVAWTMVRSDTGLEEISSSAEHEQVFAGTGALRLQARAAPGTADFAGYEIALEADGRRHMRPLAAGVRLRLAVMPLQAATADLRLTLRFRLSRQPPAWSPAELIYHLGGPLAATDSAGPTVVSTADTHTTSRRSLTLKEGEWNELTLDLTAAAGDPRLGGMDNVLGGISLAIEARRGAGGAFLVDDLHLEQQLDGDKLRDRAAAMLAALSDEDIIFYLGQEMSYGEHVNALGPGVPFIDHTAHPGGLSGEETVRFIHEHGGFAMLNHMFGVGKEFRPMSSNPDLQEVQFDSTVQKLIDNRCAGADALEVGYPVRAGMSMDAHLQVWDRVSAAAIVVTGIGSSDSHDSEQGWEDENNWITWIWSPSRSQQDLLVALRAGAAYFGNPVLFRGRMDLLADAGARMGQVVVGGPQPPTVTYLADGTRAGWTARLVADGALLEEVPVAGQAFTAQRSLPAGTTFTRFCLADGEGVLVACSNPIYFASSAPPELSAGRLAPISP